MTDTTSTLLDVSTAVASTCYSQEELLAILGVQHPVGRRAFLSGHIKERRLALLPRDPVTGRIVPESGKAREARFDAASMELGVQAIRLALERACVARQDVGAIVCVTSTALRLPGLSAMLARALELNRSCYRLDVVGMGCNAGLNGLRSLDAWARVNPGVAGVLLCCEINSVLHFPEDTAEDGVVNALFGDGVAALVLRADGVAGRGPRLIDFESYMMPEEKDAIRLDWSEPRGQWRLSLSRSIPQALGKACAIPVTRLLERHGLGRSDVRHWVLHTGGGAVIDSLAAALELSEHDVRHTRAVLRELGNLSSGSYLFSLERLLREEVTRPSELGLMITMGPGAQIEAALLRF